jgi:hypothetical protein
VGVDEDYSKVDGPWSAAVETHFFDAVERFPPTGADAARNLLLMRAHIIKAIGVELTPAQILARARYYWGNIDADIEPPKPDDPIRSSTSPVPARKKK